MYDYTQAKMNDDAIRAISSIGLAHLGDAVYELLVRTTRMSIPSPTTPTARTIRRPQASRRCSAGCICATITRASTSFSTG